jgi:hypothetical protein
MKTSADERRRWFGMLFLILALGLLIWGQTLLKPHLRGWWFILYWLICFALTGLAFLVALLDLLIMRHRAREERRRLLRETFGPVDPEDPARPSGSDRKKKPK